MSSDWSLDPEFTRAFHTLLEDQVRHRKHPKSRSFRLALLIGPAVAAAVGAPFFAGALFGGAPASESNTAVAWPRNDKGETYGVAADGVLPDLVAATGIGNDGQSVAGYIKKESALVASGGEVDLVSPSAVPLYLSDGETIIGFAIPEVHP